MAQETINIGASPNDGTGDPLRNAFNKANLNFTELYGQGLDAVTTNGATTSNAVTLGGLHINSTDAVEMPTGTDAERPSPVAGMFRFNTTSNEFEGYDGTEWGAIGGTGSSLVQDNFTGDGSTTDFTLSVEPALEVYTSVYVSGVYQQKDTYTITGTTLSLSEAPATGDTIEVIIIDNISLDAAVTSVNGLTGAVDLRPTVSVISTNTTAVANSVYVLDADVTLTLPAAPTAGDSVKISNLSGDVNCVVGRNGNNIMGVAQDLTLDTASASFELIYSGATKGWVIIGL